MRCDAAVGLVVVFLVGFVGCGEPELPAGGAAGNRGGDAQPFTDPQPAAGKTRTTAAPTTGAPTTPAPTATEDPHIRSMRNLEQIGKALLAYVARHNRLPPAATFYKARNGKMVPALSWRVELLPYLGEQKLYDEFHRDEAYDGPHNKQLISRMPDVYISPGNTDTGQTLYFAPVGGGTAWKLDQGVNWGDLTDPKSQTILLVEANRSLAKRWTDPLDPTYFPGTPLKSVGGARSEGILALFADGKARIISNSVSQESLRALFSRAGGDKVDPSAIIGTLATETASPGGTPAKTPAAKTPAPTKPPAGS